MVEIGLVISLIVLFLHACTWDGQIFSFVRNWISEDSKISNPIYNCPVCMQFWWGTAIYLILFGWGGWKHWAISIGSGEGFCVLYVIAIYIKDYCKGRTFKEEKASSQKKTKIVDADDSKI